MKNKGGKEVEQHCRTTLSEAIAHYKSKMLTAKGLIMYFFRIKLKPGAWKRTWVLDEILAELPISRSTFYKYISELRSQGAITWEVPEGTQFTISIPSDSEPSEPDSEFDLEPDNYPPRQKKKATTCSKSNLEGTAPSRGVKEEIPYKEIAHKEIAHKEVTDSSFQSFYSSLSDLEKSAFIRYVKDRTSAFPRPIANHMAWLASVDASGEPRYKEMYGDFERSPKGQEITKAKAKQMLTNELREQYAKEMEERENKGDVLPIFHKRLQASYGTPEYHIRMAYQIEWTAARDKREFLHDIKKYGLHRVIAVRGMKMASEILQRSQEELSRLLRSEEPIHALP